MRVTEFDWDKGNSLKCQKHGLSQKEIEVFFEGQIWISPAVKDFEKEDRFIAIGRSQTGRAMLVAFTLRIRNGKFLIRPISARYMHKKEAVKYEAAFKENKN